MKNLLQKSLFPDFLMSGRTILLNLICLLFITQQVFSQSANLPCNNATAITPGNNFNNLSVTSSSSILGDNFANKANVIDNNTGNYASWSHIIGASAWLEVKDNNATGSNAYPAGTFAGFVIDNSAINVLGSITLTTYLNGTQRETISGTSLLAVALLSNTAKVGFTAGLSFDAIRISFNGVSLLGTKNIYYVEMLKPCAGPTPACNKTTPLVQNNYPAVINASGTTGVTLGEIQNTDAIVDADLNNYASLTLVAGVISTGYISVKDAVTNYAAGYFAGFEVSNSSLANLNLLSNSTITTYLDGVQQEEVSSNSLIVSAPLLTSSGKTALGFVTKKSFDEIRFTINQVAGVNVGTTRVYYPIIKRFCAGSLACNTLTTVTASAYPVYVDMANTTIDGVGCIGCSLNNLDNIIDDDLSNYATMALPVGVVTSGTVAVKDAVTTYGPETFAGFDVATNSLINVGAISSATIQLLKDGVVVQSGRGNALIIGATSSLLGNNARQVVGIIANTNFDEVKLTFNQVAGANLGTISIYGAKLQRNCAGNIPCNTTTLLKAPDFGATIESTRSGITGAICAGCSINDAWNIVNTNMTDYAKIKIAAGVAATGSLSAVAAANTFPAGTYAGFMIRDNNFLVSASLLNSIRITTYNNGSQVESKTANDLLDLTVIFPIFGGQGLKNLGFITTAPYDEIRISVSALVSALEQNIDVFGAVVDTRYVPAGTPGINCGLFITVPDINYTTVNKAVTGSVATNDNKPANAYYSDPTPVNGADGAPNPAQGILNLNNDGTYTFTAPQIGVYSYQIGMCDPAGNCRKENLMITVTDPKANINPPVINTDATTTNANTSVTYPILANDNVSNANNTLGIPTITGTPLHGTAVVNPDKTITYTPAMGFVGDDSLIYSVCELPGNKCASAYEVIKVKPAVINTTLAADDYKEIMPNKMLTGNVKINDTDPDGNTQTVAAQNVTNNYGTFNLSQDGSYTYMPASSFSGTAQYIYETADNGNPQDKANGTLYVYAKDTIGVPDLMVNILVIPTQVVDAKTLNARVGVLSLTNSATDGSPIYVLIPKSKNFTLQSYNVGITTILGLPVQNADWTYLGEDALNYKFQLGGTNNKQSIAGKSVSYFGVTINFDAKGSAGKDNITAYIFDGSGGDSNNKNNSDNDVINYAPKLQ